jgi:hypothetical protein
MWESWNAWNAWIGSLLYNTFAAFVMFTVLATVYDTNQRVRSKKRFGGIRRKVYQPKKFIVETRNAAVDTNMKIGRLQPQ